MKFLEELLLKQEEKIVRELKCFFKTALMRDIFVEGEEESVTGSSNE